MKTATDYQNLDLSESLTLGLADGNVSLNLPWLDQNCVIVLIKDFFFVFCLHDFKSVGNFTAHFFKVIHKGVFLPLSPRQMSQMRIFVCMCESLQVCVSEEVCLGLLNGHSR